MSNLKKYLSAEGVSILWNAIKSADTQLKNEVTTALENYVTITDLSTTVESIIYNLGYAKFSDLESYVETSTINDSTSLSIFEGKLEVNTISNDELDEILNNN